MKNHSFSDWLKATRYWSFSVSAMPVVITAAYLFYTSSIPEPTGRALLVLALTILGAVTLHAAGNVLSDWFDYRTGVDNKDAFAVPNLVFGEFEPKEYLVFSIILFAVGAGIGVLLTIMSGPALLLIGGVGIVLTVGYSFLKYRALGDLDIFIIFSVLIMLGTSYVLCYRVCTEVLILALPVGIITVSVLHANNTIDSESDGAAGIRTFAMNIGTAASCRLYQAYMLIPFVSVVAFAAAGLLPWTCLLCLVALPQAIRNFRQASGFRQNGKEALSGLDKASAKLQLQFSGLLAVALFVSGLL